MKVDPISDCRFHHSLPAGSSAGLQLYGWASALRARLGRSRLQSRRLLARAIGPWLPVSRVAEANLSRALPELDAPFRRRLLRVVWEILGRTVAEMPHIGALRRTFDGPGWECEDDTSFVP